MLKWTKGAVIFPKAWGDVEGSQQPRAEQDEEAEAGNKVASIGRRGEKEIYLLLDYLHKAANCVAIRLRLHIADHSAEAPPKLRPRLRVPAFHNPMTQKKRETFVPLFCVPYDILFSNEYLRDLGRIWELREIVPDPNNMPWIEKIDK